MMCPPFLFFISGITSLTMRITPKKLVSNTFFISSMGMLSTGPTRPIPALLTGQEKKKETKKTRKKLSNQHQFGAVHGATRWGCILLTEDIHVSVFDAINTLFDGLIVADVQYSQRKSFPIRIPGSFHKLIFTFQITHRCYDCEQAENKEKQGDLRGAQKRLF